MKGSAIAWTTNTYNPWIGCTKVSPACDNCYAESFSMQKRFVTAWGKDTERHVTKTAKDVRAWQRRLAKTGGREYVFCASLADLFETHPTAEQERPKVWDLIRETPNLDWLLLTKRPQGFARMPADLLTMPNVWPGTTVESSAYLWRCDALIELGPIAGTKWVSYEPALGPVDFTSHLIQGIDWVIVGGESKQPLGTRSLVPFNLEWARAVIAQCRVTGATPFVKQLGSAFPQHTDPSAWPEDLRVREYPHHRMARAS